MAISVRSPIARKSDPFTSHEAAAFVTNSGIRGRQAQQVLEAVILFPLHTSAELATRAAIDRYVTARRLPELRALGLVFSGWPRICTVTRRRALVWRVRKPNEQLPLHLG